MSYPKRPEVIGNLNDNIEHFLRHSGVPEIAKLAHVPPSKTSLSSTTNADLRRLTFFENEPGDAEHFQQLVGDATNQIDKHGYYLHPYLQGTLPGAQIDLLFWAKIQALLEAHDPHDPNPPDMSRDNYHRVWLSYLDENKQPHGLAICAHKTKPHCFYIAHVDNTLAPDLKKIPIIWHMSLDFNNPPLSRDNNFALFIHKLKTAIKIDALKKMLFLNDDADPSLIEDNHLNIERLATLETELEEVNYHPFTRLSLEATLLKNKERISPANYPATEQAHLQVMDRMVSNIDNYLEGNSSGTLQENYNAYLHTLHTLNRQKKVLINANLVNMTQNLTKFSVSNLNKMLVISQEETADIQDIIDLNHNEKPSNNLLPKAARYFLKENENILKMKESLEQHKIELEARVNAFETQKAECRASRDLLVEQEKGYFEQLRDFQIQIKNTIEAAEQNNERSLTEEEKRRIAGNFADEIRSIQKPLQACQNQIRAINEQRNTLDARQKSAELKIKALTVSLLFIEQAHRDFITASSTELANDKPNLRPIKAALSTFCRTSARALQNTVLKNEKTKEHDKAIRPKLSQQTNLVQRLIDKLLEKARKILTSMPEHGRLYRNKTRSLTYRHVKKLAKCDPKIKSQLTFMPAPRPSYHKGGVTSSGLSFTV